MLPAFLKKSYAWFISRQATVYLMAILCFLYFLGLIIPQKSMLTPAQFAAWQAKWPGLVSFMSAFRLNSMYSSPPVVVLTALFFLNLLLVTARRVPAVLRGVRLPGSVHVTEANVRAMPFHEQLAMADPARVERLQLRLRALGFSIVRGNNCLKAVKNRFAPMGSLLFHGSFLLILLGGAVIFHTRFRGETFVTEGQVFGGTPAEYHSVTRLSEMRKSLPELRFTVDKIRPRFENMEPVSLETFVTAQGTGLRRSGWLDVNRPFRLGSTAVLITDVGVAPFVQVTDGQGNELLGAFVALNVIRGDEDHFVVPSTDFDIRVKFWPDAAVDETGKRITRSYNMNNPLYEVAVRKGGGTVAAGTLSAGSGSVLFDGLRLSIAGTRYFGRFMVVDERGGWLLISGFISALTGLTIKFLWPLKEVLAAWGDADGRTILAIGYRGEYLRGLGRQEFEKILAEVKS